LSRIGKQPINIPDNVEVEIRENLVKVKGPKGELTLHIEPELNVKTENKQIIVFPVRETKKTSALWGLTQRLLRNMIQGVTEGFEKQLEIVGIGYRAALENSKSGRQKLVLNLGFSHPVEIEAPEGIEFKVEKNIITVMGIDKQLVGQIAAEIRSKRKPEPYKGKGIRYLGEIVRRKPGKKAVAATS